MATRSAKIDQKADLIWAIADKLTGVYKPHEYGDVILPLTVIRRFDCILSDTKDAVLQKYDEVKNLPMKDILLRKASKKDFYNTSKYTFERLMDDPDHIEENFREYLNKFSANVRDILEKFKFDGHITTMANKGILYIVLKEYTTDRGNLHPNEISNLEMGYIFEEIIRRFSESHNEDAGQHYTPREVVDKKLSGVKAVQTLSRLNRTTRGKVDTFVLDFVNSAEDIKASFEPFYEETVLLEETDPNVVYDMKNTLDDFRVYQKSEVDKFADIFYQNENQSAGDLGKLQGQLRPAIDRYEVLEVEKQDIFKSTLASFNRVYAYITQVCRLFDKDIHRFSIYSKFLYTMLPKGHGGEKINIDDKVLLEYYKLEKDFEGPIELESTEGGYTPISGDSGHREPKKDPLTVIIDKINEKYGTHFTEMDKVLVQMENDYANQEKWQSYAKNNDRATFMLLFEKDFPNMAADRYEQNDQFFRKLFDDPDMMRQVMETVGSVLYERLKKKYIFDPKSGVIEEATPETYVEDTYLTKK